MMRGLAGFIMKGRLTAAIVALLGIPLITPAAVGLVALRLGALEGAFMVLIATVPAIIGVVMGNASGLFFLVSLATMLVVLLPALLLKATASWSFTLLVTTGVISVVSVLAAQIDGLNTALSDLVVQLVKLMYQIPEDAPSNRPGLALVSGLIAFISVFNSVTSLLLARWWQALLYNPGGFGDEFRQLRLGKVATLVLGGLCAFCYLQGSAYGLWFSVFAIPLTLVGVAVVHDIANTRKLQKIWLVMFYILLLIYSPFALMLAVIGYMDTWLNFRSRIKPAA